MTQTVLKKNIIIQGNDIILPDLCDFDLDQTLDCGQAFRWERQPDGSYIGVALEKVCHISHIDNTIVLHNCTCTDFERYWYDYFDLGRDYGALKQQFCEDPVLEKATAFAPGIRVLRQDTWETLCSFIISQNNNIKRIKGIIGRFCELYGKPLIGDFHAFPDAETVAQLHVDDLSPLRAGFRARYLIDAAQKVTSGQVLLDALNLLPLDEARAELTKITGVGIKVADCVLLYGCGRVDSFPVDVWIRRAMQRLYPEGLPECARGCAGIAQQYLFHYVRTCPQAFPEIV